MMYESNSRAATDRLLGDTGWYLPLTSEFIQCDSSVNISGKDSKCSISFVPGSVHQLKLVRAGSSRLHYELLDESSKITPFTLRTRTSGSSILLCPNSSTKGPNPLIDNNVPHWPIDRVCPAPKIISPTTHPSVFHSLGYWSNVNLKFPFWMAFSVSFTDTRRKMITLEWRSRFRAVDVVDSLEKDNEQRGIVAEFSRRK